MLDLLICSFSWDKSKASTCTRSVLSQIFLVLEKHCFVIWRPLKIKNPVLHPARARFSRFAFFFFSFWFGFLYGILTPFIALGALPLTLVDPGPFPHFSLIFAFKNFFFNHYLFSLWCSKSSGYILVQPLPCLHMFTFAGAMEFW